MTDENKTTSPLPVEGLETVAWRVRTSCGQGGFLTDTQPDNYDQLVRNGYSVWPLVTRQSAADALEAAKAEIERLRALSDPANWRDRDDQWTAAVVAVHPMNSDDPKRHQRFTTALEMVGNRHGKYELVGLVQWLLTRAERAEAEAADLRKALEEISNMCPATCETSLAHDMAQVATEALAAHAKQEPGA